MARQDILHVLCLLGLLVGSTTGLIVQHPTNYHHGRRGGGGVIQKSSKTTTNTVLYGIDPTLVIGAIVVVGGGAAALWLGGAEDRAQQQKYAEWEAKDQAIRQERATLAYVEPKELWTEAELAQYDGKDDETGPILFAADGDVFNVWKGRHFYGPGCEYQVFAGKDASRLLAKSKLEEETEEEKQVPLNVGQKAALQGWMYTFKGKYQVVGKLDGFDPKTTAF